MTTTPYNELLDTLQARSYNCGIDSVEDMQECRDMLDRYTKHVRAEVPVTFTSEELEMLHHLLITGVVKPEGARPYFSAVRKMDAWKFGDNAC